MGMQAILRAGRWSLLGAAAVALSSCVVVDEGPSYRPRPPERRPVACTMEYNPVCGERHGKERTFSNACMARAKGFRIAHGGECRRGGHNGPRPGDEQSSGMCTREYMPVCARRGDRIRSFSNACMADAKGYRVLHPGQC